MNLGSYYSQSICPFQGRHLETQAVGEGDVIGVHAGDQRAAGALQRFSERRDDALAGDFGGLTRSPPKRNISAAFSEVLDGAP